MSSLDDKLKNLGVRLGAQDIPRPKRLNPYSIENLLEGQLVETRAGDIFIVELIYPPDFIHGNTPIQVNASLKSIADWVGEPEISGFSIHDFVFIDVETTGLSGGTGTYAFLIGAGRFDNNQFLLSQFFMSDPIREPAQLIAFEEFIAPAKAIVSFNGKSFDIPVLNTRFTYHSWRSPFKEIIHIDLLHMARKLWRDRIPSRTLSNLEARILGAQRTEDDIPGWMVPALYFEFLRDGDARQLKRVFYHNEIDILSLSALLNYIAHMVADPNIKGKEYASDLISMGRLFEDLGEIDAAVDLYHQGLEHKDVLSNNVSRDILVSATFRLAMIYKRKGKYEKAVKLWEQATQLNHIGAFIELAKYYEHNAREYDTAIYWTNTAINLINTATEFDDLPIGISLFNKKQKSDEFIHRLNRLNRKHQE